jgi:mannose-6-phosphate isomerase-like protein (cupin superfamily)
MRFTSTDRSQRAAVAPGLKRAALGVAVLGLGVGLGATWARAAAGPAPAPAPAYTVENSARPFLKDAVEKTKAGYQYWFFDQSFAQGRSIKLSVVGPHLASHAPHRHEGHEFFFVLHGKAEFFLEGRTRVVGPQTALYCPPGSLHGISNAGDDELQYLVIKDYPWPSAE